LIEIHSAKLRVVDAAAFDAKRTDNLIGAFDDPKDVASCLGENLGKLLNSPLIVIAMYCSNKFSIPTGARSRLMRVHSEATGS
jgi:hypothetical protein